MALQNLSQTELADSLAGLEGWSHEGEAITKTYRFNSFADAIAFVDRVAWVAGARDHHPDIDVRFDRVRIASSTHVTSGITSRDVELAAAIDGIL